MSNFVQFFIHHRKAGVSRNLENHIVNDSTVLRADKHTSARSSDRTASGEVSNTMDINLVWLVFLAACFVTLWVRLDLIRALLIVSEIGDIIYVHMLDWYHQHAALVE